MLNNFSFMSLSLRSKGHWFGREASEYLAPLEQVQYLVIYRARAIITALARAPRNTHKNKRQTKITLSINPMYGIIYPIKELICQFVLNVILKNLKVNSFLRL